MNPGFSPSHMFDGGDMDCGSGLILLIRQNLLQVPPGGVMELRSAEPSVTLELPPWCRMTGHEYLETVEDGIGRWRHYVRRGADSGKEAAALEDDKRKAQAYEWRVRLRATGNQEATAYARNFSWKVGQPASFEEKDDHPSALEYALSALAADLTNGFATLCRQRGMALDELECSLKARLTSVMAHLGMEAGDPSLANVDLTLFVTSPVKGEDLRAIWQEAQRRSPLYQTLTKACQIDARLAVM